MYAPPCQSKFLVVQPFMANKIPSDSEEYMCDSVCVSE